MLVSRKIATAHFLHKVSDIPIGCAGIGALGTIYFRVSETDIIHILGAQNQEQGEFPVAVMSVRNCRKAEVRPLMQTDKVIFNFDNWDRPHEVKTAHLREKTAGKPGIDEIVKAPDNV